MLEASLSKMSSGIGIFELLVLDDELRGLISEGPCAFDIQKGAKE